MAISGIINSFDQPYYRASFSEKGIGKNDISDTNVNSIEIEDAVDKIDMEALVNSLNKESSLYGERITFSYNEKAHSVVMKVINDKTSEVIREIPARDAVKLAENIREYLGTIIDELG